jgi:protein-S-isoprenylcysteine O-methyltransferase Ste14
LLSRSAAAIYANGIEALQPPDGTPIETTTFSTAGGTRRVMELLSESNHDRVEGFLQPLAIVLLLLAAVVLFLGQGFSRFAGLGLAMVGAATMVFLGALVLKFAIAFIGSDGSAVAEEFSQLVDAVAWTPARNAIVFGAGGVALLVPASLLNWFFDRSFVPDAPVIDTPPRTAS